MIRRCRKYDFCVYEKMNKWIILTSGLIILIPCATADIRTRQIPLRLIGVDGLITMLVCGYSLYRGDINWQWILQGIIPGALMVFLSFASGRKIGSGDGILLSLLGMLTGMWMVTVVLMTSLLLSFPVSAILLITHRTDRSGKIPFVPFMTGGFLLTVLAGI